MSTSCCFQIVVLSTSFPRKNPKFLVECSNGADHHGILSVKTKNPKNTVPKESENPGFMVIKSVMIVLRRQLKLSLCSSTIENKN